MVSPCCSVQPKQLLQFLNCFFLLTFHEKQPLNFLSTVKLTNEGFINFILNLVLWAAKFLFLLLNSLPQIINKLCNVCEYILKRGIIVIYLNEVLSFERQECIYIKVLLSYRFCRFEIEACLQHYTVIERRINQFKLLSLRVLLELFAEYLIKISEFMFFTRNVLHQ